jgi:hypothetical protein
MTPAELSDFCDWVRRNREPNWDLVVADQDEWYELDWRFSIPIDWERVDREAGGVDR